MKYLLKFRFAIIFAGIWLAAFLFYLFTASAVGGSYYVADKATAIKLGEPWWECSGGAYFYPELGFRCDGYGPKTVVYLVILVGVVAFIMASVSLSRALYSKPSSD